MKEKYNPLNIGLGLALIFIATQQGGSLARGLGAGLWYLAMGAVIGLILMGLFRFFFKIAKPENTFKPGRTEWVTFALIGAIIYALLIAPHLGKH